MITDFSTLLSEHIHSKNIKTSALAQFCGLDRSNMYKIIKGQRKPTSLDMVRNICKFMHLTPSEQAEMEKAYQITVIGPENYYRRKSVLRFFEEFRLSLFRLPPAPTANFSDNVEHIMHLNSQQEVNRSLLYIISSELKKHDGKIDLLIQPNAEFLMDILASGDYDSSSVKIRHIICLNNNQTISSARQNYNLNSLKRIIPLYCNHYQYNCYYYYDNVDSVTNAFSLFPYAVITPQCACLLTADLQSGLTITAPVSLKFFSRLYEQYLRQSSPLLCPINDSHIQLGYIQKTMHNPGHAYSFQMLPCLTPFLTIDLVNKCVLKELPEREKLMNSLIQHLKNTRTGKVYSGIDFICSLDGVRKFLETGRTGEYPEQFCSPFCLQDRIYLIRQLAAAVRGENYHLLKHNIGSVDNEFFLFISQQKGYFMFPTPGHQLVYLNIEEPELLYTFFDFCESLEDDLFYPPEEARSQLLELIREYAHNNT